MRYLKTTSILFFHFILGMAYSQSVDSLVGSAEVALKNDRYIEALNYYDQAVEKCQNCGSVKKSDLWIGKSIAHAYNGEYPDQYACAKKALDLAKKSGQKAILLRAHVNIAEYFRGREEYQSAKNHLIQAKSLKDHPSCEKQDIAKLYNRYSAVFNEEKKYPDSAMYYSRKALNLAEELDDLDLRATSLNEIGFIYEQSDDTKSQCFSYYQKASDLWLQDGQLRVGINPIINMARAYKSMDEFEKSLEMCDKGISLVGDNDWPYILVYLYEHKKEVLEYMGRYKEAMEANKEYHQVALRFKKLEWNQELAKVAQELNLAEKENQIKTEKSKKRALASSLEAEKSRIFYLVIIAVLAVIMLVVVFVYFRRSRKYNRELIKSISAKELLLKEVHHRVKNNLQIISSLLNQQAVQAQNESLRNLVDDGQRRIKSMAMIHQRLYQTEDFSNINMENYARELTTSIASALNPENKEVEVIYEMHDTTFNIDTAAPLGLILNELITNVYKYAFQGRNSGKVWISMKRLVEDQFELKVKDNGIGLPEDFEEKSRKSLGISLVKGLGWQLRGEMKYLSDKGSTFIVTFNSNVAK